MHVYSKEGVMHAIRYNLEIGGRYLQEAASLVGICIYHY